VLDHVRIDAAAGVHVGDDAAADVAGAQGVGMRAIHFVPAAAAQSVPADTVLTRFADLPDFVARLG
jgi:FMN phosphatase YigB (HAD superfamily)